MMLLRNTQTLELLEKERYICIKRDQAIFYSITDYILYLRDKKIKNDIIANNLINTWLCDSTIMTATSGDSGSVNATSTPWISNGTIHFLNKVGWPIDQCMVWQRPHHLYFQLGNTFLFLAFLAPNISSGMLWLRIMLIIAAIFFAMFGYVVDCSQDLVIWSGLFFGINFIYIIVIITRLRAVRFDQEIEAVSY